MGLKYFVIVGMLLTIPYSQGFNLWGLFGGNNTEVGEKGDCSHWGGEYPFRTDIDELFNEDDLIARHRTLPIGSYATVTNLRTGKSVVVRITGHGLNVVGRIMDLSPAAYSQISDISEPLIECKVVPRTARPPSTGYTINPLKEGSRPRPASTNQEYPSDSQGYDFEHPKTPY